MTRFTRRAARFVLGAALVASLAPIARAEHPTPDCTDRGQTFAKMLKPTSGEATVNAGPAGTYTLATGGPTPSVTLSFTGTMDVVIEYSCMITLGLTVTKEGVGTSPAVVVHSASWNLGCEHATKTEPVTIGLDGGHYRFALSGTSCSGIGLKHTPEGGLVGDPPLL